MRAWAAPLVFAFAVLPLQGCSASSKAVPFPVESAYDTAVVHILSLDCTTTYTVHRDGSAQRFAQGCKSENGTRTVTFTRQDVASLFSDLEAAQPLNALPVCPGPDFAINVAWNGQQSPSLGPCFVGTPIEQALVNDIESITVRFEPVP
ncbi:MAG TPA: hypothetical protein VFH72_00940 [Candidatus Baltobacteraceae bacterium]|nr:hypothetical protein [Candidatus Baltobacteraceae bacterium]